MVHHYIQRDLDNCIDKLNQERKIHPDDWRVIAGVAGCKGDEQYQPNLEMSPLWETGSFYAAATVDRSVQKSWFGRNMGALLSAMGRKVGEGGELKELKIVLVEEVPRMVDLTY